MENVETLNHQHNSINFHKDEYDIEPGSFHNSDIYKNNNIGNNNLWKYFDKRLRDMEKLFVNFNIKA